MKFIGGEVFERAAFFSPNCARCQKYRSVATRSDRAVFRNFAFSEQEFDRLFCEYIERYSAFYVLAFSFDNLL